MWLGIWYAVRKSRNVPASQLICDCSLNERGHFDKKYIKIKTIFMIYGESKYFVFLVYSKTHGRIQCIVNLYFYFFPVVIMRCSWILTFPRELVIRRIWIIMRSSQSWAGQTSFHTHPTQTKFKYLYSACREYRRSWSTEVLTSQKFWSEFLR